MAALKSIASALGVDPMRDPEAFNRALMGSADARTQRDRTAEDATGPQLGDPGYGDTLLARHFNRSQTDAAQGASGFNRDWVPYFESQNVQADANPKMNFRTNYGGLADMMTTEPSGDQPGQAQLPVRKGGTAPSMRALSKVAGY